MKRVRTIEKSTVCTIFYVIVVLIVLRLVWITIYSKRAEIRERFEDKYNVSEHENFLSLNDCAVLIETAQSDMQRSTVVAAKGSVESPERTSRQKWLCYGDLNPVLETLVHAVHTRAAKLLGDVPNFDKFECMQLAAYGTDGQYTAHYDAKKCVNQDDGAVVDRKSTILVYLNDDFEGGQTYFPNIDVTITPKAGKAVLFHNYGSDGCEEPSSLHQGLPVLSGTKYIANIWLQN